ncbi:hypothetical protein BU26DRAFT_505088 [Trematosphaeria pertusa]|uniref:C2H2-type domain-containing protein n=1 Tax=Trematosphaeria pertusa TaxID=390896 RepID=A0A6A6IEZ9_9PLEO|nr:uncharacterized protein BU26DRAFT_505088 [Trematosphaeria pertusa]KAF2248976.1 hypothetical protein BU26DRAFT_505088 [Trematosphaeria pertusa]
MSLLQLPPSSPWHRANGTPTLTTKSQLSPEGLSHLGRRPERELSQLGWAGARKPDLGVLRPEPKQEFNPAPALTLGKRHMYSPSVNAARAFGLEKLRTTGPLVLESSTPTVPTALSSGGVHSSAASGFSTVHGFGPGRVPTSAAEIAFDSIQAQIGTTMEPPKAKSNGSGDVLPKAKRTQKHPATFQCTLCPKRFTRAYNLRSHLRTHADERPFICSVCGKAFSRQNDRKRHEHIHNRRVAEEEYLRHQHDGRPRVEVPSSSGALEVNGCIHMHYTISQDTTTAAAGEARKKEKLCAVRDRRKILPAKTRCTTGARTRARTGRSSMGQRRDRWLLGDFRPSFSHKGALGEVDR